jgi:hypothetical protein
MCVDCQTRTYRKTPPTETKRVHSSSGKVPLVTDRSQTNLYGLYQNEWCSRYEFSRPWKERFSRKYSPIFKYSALNFSTGRNDTKFLTNMCGVPAMDYQETVSHWSPEFTSLFKECPITNWSQPKLQSCSVRVWVDIHKFWGNPTNASRDIQPRSYIALQLNWPPLTTHRNQTYAVYSECGVMFLQENDSNGSRDAAERARYLSSKVTFTDRSLRGIYKLSKVCVQAALYIFPQKVQFSEMFCPFSLTSTVNVFISRI